MMVLSQVFSNREEGVRGLMHLSPTIGKIFQSYLRPSYKDFSSTLARYIDHQPRPQKAREPFEEASAIKLTLTPGHLRFKSPGISVEIVPDKGGWKFTIAGTEVDDAMSQPRNQKRAKIMGWDAREEFPDKDYK
ncbi:MAG: hypothetical protein HY001_03935 [Candidatus Portnoybacteria bacterium]|nr:hypothetical protein [Candidatus Portnoybacteria bacterium]